MIGVSIEEFPPKAKAYLNFFYEAKGILNGNVKAKINALRESHKLTNAVFSANGGTMNLEEELKLIEFYILSKRGFI